MFLNHCGPDMKDGFIMVYLKETVKHIGLNPFLDKKSLMKETLLLEALMRL